MDRYVVFGNPVAHSLSPAIHALFAAQAGESLTYERMRVDVGDFARAARAFFAGGGRGANVTLPFKVDAFEFAHEKSPRALQAGAANLLMWRDGTVYADNTDGAGLVADLTANLEQPITGKRVLALGAGGAVRGVLGPLLAQRPSLIVVANRTPDKARDLAHRFKGEVQAVALEAIPRTGFDIVINGTSSSVLGEALELPAHVLAQAGLAYDMAYGPKARDFIDRARAAGARTSDGLGMLVEQAAESYAIWRGRRPATQPVLRELRSRIA